MSDLIKRDDAIKAIECRFNADLMDRIDAMLMTSAIAQITKNIANIPSADKQGEWIPCSEKLPSKGVPVLVNGIMEDAPPITISNDAPLYYEKGWINAWMPLPEPWKGADDDAD